MSQFEYLVCRVNFQRVTFANDQWQGRLGPEAGRKDADIQSCPTLWEYLAKAGREGWELVSAVNSSIASNQHEGIMAKMADQTQYQMLFLKRELGQ